ncbi:MAG: hypothetical protein M3Q99_09100 [Acidobacteriota bacterium]|nr:hypothetical protein [Acidobacteriota bacterium]
MKFKIFFTRNLNLKKLIPLIFVFSADFVKIAQNALQNRRIPKNADPHTLQNNRLGVKIPVDV